MKAILIGLLLTAAPACAQELTPAQADTFAQRLVQRQILNEKGRLRLLEWLRAAGTDADPNDLPGISREAILFFLSDAFGAEEWRRLEGGMKAEQHTWHEDSLNYETRTFSLSSGPSGRNPGLIHPKRSTIGYTLTRTLNDVHAIGLIDEPVYQEGVQELRKKIIPDESYLLRLLYNNVSYRRQYPQARRRQEAFVAGLVAQGLLRRSGADSLLASYQPYELKSQPHLLAYSDRYREVDLSDIPSDPALVYPRIFEAAKTLVPGFTYTNLRTCIDEEPPRDGLAEQTLLLQFDADGHTYSHRAFYHFRIAGKNDRSLHKTEPLRVVEDFQSGINRLLTDRESPYRLFVIDADSTQTGHVNDSRRLGLLLLRAGEDSVLLGRREQISFDNKLSRRSLDSLISGMTRLGFFSHLQPGELEQARRAIDEKGVQSLAHVLALLPRTVVSFEWETGNLDDPYAELTRGFAAASRGAFRPAAITDGFGKALLARKKATPYGFTHQGKRYAALLPLHDDWLDGGFLKLIGRALRESGSDLRLYSIGETEEGDGYLLLGPEQAAFLREILPELEPAR